MISYFKYNKGNFEPLEFEDNLTSLFIDMMSYLPQQLFWKILSNSLYYDALPQFSTDEILDIEFWPKWKIDKETRVEEDNKGYVEPDVFIRGNQFDLIIEAKYKGNKQEANYAQLKREIRGYYTEFGILKKPIYLLAIDGNENNMRKKLEGYEEVILLKTDWQKILQTLDNELRALENSIDNLPTLHVLQNLITGFELHGYLNTKWLEELLDIDVKYNKDLKLFDYA